MDKKNNKAHKKEPKIQKKIDKTIDEYTPARLESLIARNFQQRSK